jgi:hypothetical protein
MAQQVLEHELAIQKSYIDTGVFGLETEVHGTSWADNSL